MATILPPESISLSEDGIQQLSTLLQRQGVDTVYVNPRGHFFTHESYARHAGDYAAFTADTFARIQTKAATATEGKRQTKTPASKPRRTPVATASTKGSTKTSATPKKKATPKKEV